MTYDQLVAAGIFKDNSFTDGFNLDVKEPYYQRRPKEQPALFVQSAGRGSRHGTPTGTAPSKKCLDDARKIMGKKPYNQPGNYLVGDGYFAQACIGKYGQAQWDKACKQVEDE